MAEAEVENFMETDTASAKSVQGVSSNLWNELANIKAMVNKTWNSQQKAQQKRGQQGGGAKKKREKKPNQQAGACFGCGGSGQFIRDCPSTQEKSLNSNRGEKDPGPLRPRI